jgi:hypothetical protein
MLCVHNDDTATWGFYLLPTRSWELFAGALCALTANNHESVAPNRNWHFAGIAAILLSGIFIDSKLPLQPLFTAIPVLSAALILRSGVVAPAWAVISPVRWLGQASYSIYLWHWPVIAMFSFLSISATGIVVPLGVTIAIGLGFLSYVVVERYLTRKVFDAKRTRGALSVTAVYIVAIVAAVLIVKTDAFEALRTRGRPAQVIAALSDRRVAVSDWRYPSECAASAKVAGKLALCLMGDPSARDTLVMGDSHMQQIAARFARPFSPGHGVTFLTHGGCMPVPGTGRLDPGSPCSRWVRAAFRYAETSHYKRVVIGSIWFGYFEPKVGESVPPLCFETAMGCVTSSNPKQFDKFVSGAFHDFRRELIRLKVSGSEVVVIGPFPAFKAADPAYLYKIVFLGGAVGDVYGSLAQFRERTSKSMRLLTQATAGEASLIDPTSYLCANNVCPIVERGHALFKDASHYRASIVKTERFAFLDKVLLP